MNRRLVFGVARRAAKSLRPAFWILVAILATSESMPAREVELAGQAGGGALAVAVRGRWAYLAQGPNLVVLDVGDPAAPRAVGWVPLEGAPDRIVVQGSRVYLAGPHVFEIVDVNIPAAPRWMGAFTDFQYSEGLAVAGDTAYLGDGIDLLALDISQPSRIRLAGLYFNGIHAVRAVRAQGGLLYAATDGGLLVLDLAQPGKPRFRGAFQGTGAVSAAWARDLAVCGDTVYLATAAGLLAIDVTRPDQPWMRTICAALACGSGLAAERGTVCVADLERRLVVLEAGGPDHARPRLVEDRGIWASFALQGGLLFGADPFYGLRILSLSGEKGLCPIGEYLTDSPQEILVDRSLVYAANGTRGLEIFDFKTPRRPLRRGAWGAQAGWTEGLALAGGRVYVADARTGLHVLDADAPDHIQRLGGWKTPGAAHKVAIDGNTAYVAAGRAGLQILNIFQPDRIRPRACFPTVGEALDVAVDDKTAYALSVLRDGEGDVTASHLQAVDVRWPDRPRLFGGFFVVRWIEGLAFHDACAFLCGDWNLYQLEMNEYDLPELTGRWTSDDLEFARDVAFKDNLMFVADAWRGLLVFDTAAPGHASRLVAAWEVPGGFARSLALGDDGTIYLASETSGIYALRLK